MAEPPTESGTEIERRWLVKAFDPQVLQIPGKYSIQGYFETSTDVAFQVRIVDHQHAVMTRKTGSGLVRGGVEQTVSLEDARFMLAACSYVLEKICRKIDGWELDTLQGALLGFVFLVKKLKDPDETVVLPPWVTEVEEVTNSLSSIHLAKLVAEMRLQTPNRTLTSYSIPRIVVTGGPCSGKKSVLIKLAEVMRARIHCVPETILSHITRLGFKTAASDQDAAAVKRGILRAQMSYENLLAEQAIADGKSALVLDTGIIDHAVDLPGGLSELEHLAGMRAHQIIARYDSVLILNTPGRQIYQPHADRHPGHLSYDEAVGRSQKVFELWSRHPRNRPVYSTRSVEDKALAVQEWVEQAIQVF